MHVTTGGAVTHAERCGYIEPLSSLVTLVMTGLIYVMFICAGVFGGHPICARKQVTKGPRYEFVGSVFRASGADGVCCNSRD